MHTKMCIHYLLIRRVTSYKVCLCFVVLLVTVCTVRYVCSFRRDQIFMDFVSFLSMPKFCIHYHVV